MQTEVVDEVAVEHVWPAQYIHVLVLEANDDWKRIPVQDPYALHTAETLSKDFLTMCLVVSTDTGDVIASFLRGERII
jgi:hypothetical protein